MAKLIPNERTQIVFVAAGGIANKSSPTVAEINAGTNVTGFIVSLEASSSGNQVNTPALDSLFETSISGTVTATFTAEGYRDDTADTLWNLVPRGTNGFFVISRFGFGGATYANPAIGDKVEVWPIKITTRSATPLTSNDSQRFNVEAAVPEVPAENATVA